MSFVESGDVMPGMATVDGTSFAAPYVAALVAHELAELRAQRPGASAHEAGRRLISKGVPLTGQGEPGTAVALDTPW